MSVATATVIPRQPRFPALLPSPTGPRPIPQRPQGTPYAHMNAHRDLNRELDDLSEEEADILEITNNTANRGHTFLVPLGRTLTQQEEKNDADDEEDDTDDDDDDNDSGGQEEDANTADESAQDLDASMEDLDNDEEEVSD